MKPLTHATLGVALVALLLLLLYRSAASPDQADSPASAGSAALPSPAANQAAHGRAVEEPTDRAAVAQKLPAVLVTEESGAPLPGTALRPFQISETGILDLEVPPLTASGPDGRLAHAALAAADSRFLVSHPDFVSAVIEGAIHGEQRLTLRAAPRLTVLVLAASGAPLSDTKLVLSPQINVDALALPPKTDGDPLHGRPVWTRTSDSTGRVEFSTAPPGVYYLQAFHAHHVPLQHEPQVVRLAASMQASVTMQDMYGVVFAAPSTVPINDMEWSWGRSSVDQSYGVVSRIAYCTELLERRFPDAHVFVRRPAFSQVDVKVGLRLILEDGTSWKGSWPLTPLADITAPVYLEQDLETRFRRLRVELVSPAGKRLEVPLRIASLDVDYSGSDAPYVDAVEPGTSQFLAYGRYIVEPDHYATWMQAACKDLGFVVSASEPLSDVVRLTMQRELVHVRIEPQLPGPTCISPVVLLIDDPKQEGLGIANWKPSRGVINLLAPPGPLTVKGSSQGYEDVDLEFTVLDQEQPQTFAVPLVERRNQGVPR